MDAIELFKKAAMAMQTDYRYLALDAARRAADEDKELQDLIGDFNLARMDLENEMGKDDRDDAHIAQLNMKIGDLYNKAMNHPSMLAYNEAKAEADQMIAYIDAIINTAMNGGDPMLVQEPAGGCTGSCSSCAGCH